MSMPDSLHGNHRAVSRDRAFRQEAIEFFRASSWLAMFAGFDILPRYYSPSVDDVPEAELCSRNWQNMAAGIAERRRRTRRRTRNSFARTARPRFPCRLPRTPERASAMPEFSANPRRSVERALVRKREPRRSCASTDFRGSRGARSLGCGSGVHRRRAPLPGVRAPAPPGYVDAMLGAVGAADRADSSARRRRTNSTCARSRW